jgi:hypothetical protein
MDALSILVGIMENKKMFQTTNQYNFITMTPCTIATTRNPQHKCRRVGAISRSAELKMTWCFFSPMQVD